MNMYIYVQTHRQRQVSIEEILKMETETVIDILKSIRYKVRESTPIAFF